MGTHEDFSRHLDVRGVSNRSFGVTFAVIFTIIAIVPLQRDRPIRFWALVVATGFAVIALWLPSILHRPNHLWMRFGLLLSRFVNPVVMFLVFYFVVTPVGFIARSLGTKFLSLGFDGTRSSYWIERQPPGPAPETMSQQF